MTKQEIIDNCMDYLDFEKIHKVMKFLNWTWTPTYQVPEIYEIRRFLRNLLNEFIDKNLPQIQCGGFRIRKDRDSIIITFEIEETIV